MKDRYHEVVTFTDFTDEARRYGFNDVVAAFRSSGIHLGDSIFVHSELKSIGRLADIQDRDEFTRFFIDALLEVIGQDGNLMMPTFTYSYTKKESFDPLKTPSTVGILTERFRSFPGVLRSTDPIFSISAIGPEKNFFVDVGQDCFGEGSIFQKLHQRNAKIVFIGERFDITYMHYVEQCLKVPYRYIKEFSGQTSIKGELKTSTCKYLVRDLDGDVNYDLEGTARYFEQCGILKQAPLGATKIRVVGAQDAFAAIESGIKSNGRFLLEKKG